MRFQISGLHPVTGNWIILQEESTLEKASKEEIDEGLNQYTDLIKNLIKIEPNEGCQLNISGPKYRIIFDPRKFLAVQVRVID